MWYQYRDNQFSGVDRRVQKQIYAQDKVIYVRVDFKDQWRKYGLFYLLGYFVIIGYLYENNEIRFLLYIV